MDRSGIYLQSKSISLDCRKFGGQEGDCPVTEDISDRLVRLPLFYNLTDPEQEFILETITKLSV